MVDDLQREAVAMAPNDIVQFVSLRIRNMPVRLNGPNYPTSSVGQSDGLINRVSRVRVPCGIRFGFSDVQVLITNTKNGTVFRPVR